MFDTNSQGPTRLGASLIMVMLCGLWSMAGVVSRQIESAHSIEVTFWRSAFCFLMLVVWTSIYTRNNPFRQMMAMGWAGVLSGLFWCIMFTCFMVALMMTTVANTLLTIGLSPLIAAILARLILGMFIPRVTWLCIVIAAIGMWWMFREGLSGNGLIGVLIALAVPFASAMNLILLRKTKERINLAPAVMLGGLFCCLLMLPFVFPMSASGSDMAWLAFLGVFQLALPCTILVWVSRFLPPQEIALLAVLEIVLGSLWAWLWGNESIPLATLQGGLLIIGALMFNTLRS